MINMKKSGFISICLASVVSMSAISLASAAWTFVDVLNYWQRIGVFTYILPFLLVFAVVFGIITKTTILGENRAVHAIIALAIGLLSLVGDYVPNFFQVITPYLGVGLSILLVGIVLLGLFYQEVPWIQKLLVWVGIVIFLVIVYSALSNTGFAGNNVWNEYGPAIVTVGIIAAMIALIVALGGKKK